MATTKHSAYAAVATALTTELNSIANNANTAAGAAIDNSSALAMFADVELYVAAMATARATGATIELYITPALDGTNYSDVNETTAELIASFPLDAATTARRIVRRDIPIPPGLYKPFARNRTGQTIAGSANVVIYRTHNVDTA